MPPSKDSCCKLPNQKARTISCFCYGISKKDFFFAFQSRNTPSEFPLCPSEAGPNALADYLLELKDEVVFARNQYGESKVVLATLSEDSDKLFVVCNNPEGIKEWSFARVFIDTQFFVHESFGTFFTIESAKKQFTLARGLEWEGGDTIDDYS